MNLSLDLPMGVLHCVSDGVDNLQLNQFISIEIQVYALVCTSGQCTFFQAADIGVGEISLIDVFYPEAEEGVR
jgi:hypothetical protein